eukprot:99713-Alexandrium_andersonii.AAC.1
MADHTEHLPGLEQAAPRPKRSRSAGASPSTRSPPITSAPTKAPTLYGPSGAVGGYRRAPGTQTQEPPQVNPETARGFDRASRDSGWLGGGNGGGLQSVGPRLRSCELGPRPSLEEPPCS